MDVGTLCDCSSSQRRVGNFDFNQRFTDYETHCKTLSAPSKRVCPFRDPYLYFESPEPIFPLPVAELSSLIVQLSVCEDLVARIRYYQRCTVSDSAETGESGLCVHVCHELLLEFEVALHKR